MLCPFIILSQDIPNSDFEDWVWVGGWYEAPADWTTMNNQVITHTEKDDMACEGDYAFKVYPLPGFETTMGQAQTVFPIDYIPATLDFCAKTNIVTEVDFVDTCRVRIEFWNFDIMVYQQVWTNTESLDNWTNISLELDQIEPVITMCVIKVEASYPGMGLGSGSPETWISIDDIAFGTIDSIDSLEYGTVFSMYPNPSNGETVTLSSDGPIGHFQVYDMLGHLVFSEFSASDKVLLEHELAPGAYLVQSHDQIRKLLITD